MRWSLRARVMALCVLSFAAGAVLFTAGAPFFRDWWLSVFAGHAVCAGGVGPDEWVVWSCPPWPGWAQVLASAGVLAGVAGLFWIARRAAGQIARPVVTMTDTVRQLGPQNLGQRIRYDGPGDQVAALAHAVDDMLDRVATGYEGQRRFASNASHELRTPLAVQRTLVEVALVTGEQDLSRLAAQLLAVNERNERLIEGLLVLAESDRGLPGTEPVAFDELVGEVVARFTEQADKQELTLNYAKVENIVSGDPVLLDRMVSNLIHNAIKYNEPGGRVDIVVAIRPTLSIRNTGPVIPAETVPALFEPFRRLSAERVHQRDGAGLGLSIVRSVVTAHNGTVSAAPADNGGLQVTVNLP
ncbi:HAMP domain-containing sensor histidine kinase [Actinophytocola sp.]|uniref:sensor histidine kinase n=1 Tax=Actinophytocola sp. TaxID=1872138 RepID=UPI002D7EA963|nr:HAMP domain-containing sensor histidine kinase [Actinophytocola sp.]HET9139794.1 HAMP domain-containing sensor histidine kinase [Actinophytocola sp.]